MDVYYVRIGNSKQPRVRIGDTIYDVRKASRILAGLEVALAKALREAGRGKCLRCGLEQDIDPTGAPCCWNCCGVLEPVERIEVEAW